MLCRKCTNCNRLGYFTKDWGARPRMVTPVNTRNPIATRGVYFECGGTDHYKAACPRLIRAPRLGGNQLNQVMTIEGGQGRGNNSNQACRGSFMMGAKEACQDSNSIQIMPPTMMTRSIGQLAAVSRGGGTGGRAGKGGGRTRGRSGDQGDGRIDGQCGQVGGQGSEVNDSVNGVP
ncbi:hypothetical protein Tco_0777253, partial [Tanacetum coccineum]